MVNSQAMLTVSVSANVTQGVSRSNCPLGADASDVPVCNACSRLV